jgi:hypothetical protein
MVCLEDFHNIALTKLKVSESSKHSSLIGKVVNKTKKVFTTIG